MSKLQKIPNQMRHGNTEYFRSKPTRTTTAKHNTENTTTKTDNTNLHF